MKITEEGEGIFAIECKPEELEQVLKKIKEKFAQARTPVVSADIMVYFYRDLKDELSLRKKEKEELPEESTWFMDNSLVHELF